MEMASPGERLHILRLQINIQPKPLCICVFIMLTELVYQDGSTFPGTEEQLSLSVLFIHCS